MSPLQPPTSYQGAKQRLASDICSLLPLSPDLPFWDICGGSGAVALEAMNRGMAPSNVTIVDAGPWGLFWRMIGSGTFCLTTFWHYCVSVPRDLHRVKPFLQELASLPASHDTAYRFLLLQSGAFGGKAVWNTGDRWVHPGFRAYWLPTETSSRRSPVTPMKPLASTLYERTARLAERLIGLQAVHGRAEDVLVPREAILYVDPPYQGTTGYGYDLDVLSFVSRRSNPIYVSEARALSPAAIPLLRGRRAGGITGETMASCREWLSAFNEAPFTPAGLLRIAASAGPGGTSPQSGPQLTLL